MARRTPRGRNGTAVRVNGDGRPAKPLGGAQTPQSGDDRIVVTFADGTKLTLIGATRLVLAVPDWIAAGTLPV